MKSEDVVVGEKYTVRISGNLVPVRIDATAKLHRFSKSYNGWTGTNLKTGRPVTILTAAASQLRGSARRDSAPYTADGAPRRLARYTPHAAPLRPARPLAASLRFQPSTR